MFVRKNKRSIKVELEGLCGVDVVYSLVPWQDQIFLEIKGKRKNKNITIYYKIIGISKN